MSPLRKWIVETLKKQFPNAPTVFFSDTHPAIFKDLTGISHEGLLETWYGPKDKKTGVRTPVPGVTAPTFTTCSSFLSRFATRVRQAGALATSFYNYQIGKQQDVITRGFELNVEIGWVPAGGGRKPAVGDFFMLGTQGYGDKYYTDHAGVILEIENGNWSKVAGGAGSGGSPTRRDSVKRTTLEAPGGVLGWLNVDKHFQGWAGPGAEDAIYDEYKEEEEDIYEYL